jgi:UDP-N-acetylmuramate dehydrogenase
MKVHHHVSLKPYNTFGIDQSAHQLVEVTSVEQVQEAIALAGKQQLPVLFLGGGSNILLTQDFPGLVVRLQLRGIEKVHEDHQHVWVKAGAGENWHQFVLHCLKEGWAGVENLSLIPGTVGAAPMQNIGAYGVEIKDVFHSLEALEIATGKMHTFDKEACQFGYRESFFKHKGKGKFVICSVTFQLSKTPHFQTSYGAITATLQEMGVTQLSIKAISDAVISIRQSKLPDPAQIGNAGSFFKNPVISPQHYADLKKAYPEMPGFPQREGVKVPAGWLIEQCGWKGKTIGNVGVHARQALVLVNHGHATGAEVEQLSIQIRQSVETTFKIALTPEVNFI